MKWNKVERPKPIEFKDQSSGFLTAFADLQSQPIQEVELIVNKRSTADQDHARGRPGVVLPTSRLGFHAESASSPRRHSPRRSAAATTTRSRTS